MLFERTPNLVLSVGCFGILFLLTASMVTLGQEAGYLESNVVIGQTTSQPSQDTHNDRVMFHLNRIQIKQEIIHNLIQERMTFRQAAEHFLELLTGDDFALGLVRRSYPASTALESCAKSIVDFVRDEMTFLEPENAPQIQARVQRQYRELFLHEAGDFLPVREEIP